MTARVAQNNSTGMDTQRNDAKSVGSYRSTHSTRSSVLERAREYNRRIDEQKQRRSKSLERQAEQSDAASATSGTPRSQSAGRIPANNQGQGNRISTRERALASVHRESTGGGSFGSVDPSPSHSNNSFLNNNGGNSTPNPHRGRSAGSPSHSIEMEQMQQQQPAPTPQANNSAYSSHVSRPKPTTPRMSGSYASNNSSNHDNKNPVRNSSPSSSPRHDTRAAASPAAASRHHHRDTDISADRSVSSRSRNDNNNSNNFSRESPARSMKSSSHHPKEENHEAVVTPELLVDALSGHEDGLLAIAERLMEHYDSGYDVMGEAIIDAFADVQKLFQHVVEAAHMEGAAFESSRKEEEIAELRKQVATASAGGGGDLLQQDGLVNPASPENNGNGPVRHDEFIDQDVKDILTEAIRKGTNYRDNGKFSECFDLYERACQSASALLPVDSDHRGRLQLSIARAESMNHDRACAILRYAMDDVLRSGLRAGSVPLPDPSQRADVVLNRPKGQPHITGTTGQAVGVGQSTEEALNSLVEEMKEVMNAPVYNNTPLQNVAKRFLAALADAQKQQQKNEEKLEQNLAKLKGDFLLARAVRYIGYCWIFAIAVCLLIKRF